MANEIKYPAPKDRLVVLRRIHGTSQPLLAQRSGVSLQRIKQIEGGTGSPFIRIDTARKLAEKGFGIPVAELVEVS